MKKIKQARSKPKITRRRVIVTLDAPDAETVILMGDFNEWNAKIHPMKKEDDGAWKKIIMVPPGRYEYRFLVDGEWWNDPGNSQVCPNCFGSLNNFLIVE
ncbi:MAG: glycogen-binding domain-containing protein [Proteobacteria bacterium]|nr:glycoside hydrolase [Desulfobacterales bacterium]MBL6967608.1 glycogen-binding domain-containing protein [Desulfobacteraceae bacterium]MBU0988639.1 glycogen-binding domain-containing protein [Pseudomonadota bacterium]MBL7101925.1 glycogen-binding domain-containing protein [Desulfobacteraceae bacterium]MBL7171669.1 glycogen-binding domain-containing protein [Desulfobacteraceae bacterium]